MDICIVCCKSNEDVFSRITTVSSEWKECEFQRIIEKHLWWWYLRPPSSNGTEQWICCQCWNELSSFHNFYTNVEKQHHKLYEVLLLFQNDKDEETAASIIKVEDQLFSNESTSAKKLSNLKKTKRGRKRKMCDKPENIQFVDLPVAQVKLETEVKPETEINHNSEASKTEMNPNILDIDVFNSPGGEYCFFSDTQEKNDGLEIELNLLSKRKNKRKVKTSNSVNKFRKQYTKIEKETKNKLSEISAKSQVMKKNDEFIAESDFQLSCSVCSVTLSNFNNLKNHFRKEHNTLGYAMCCNKKFYKRGVLVDHLNVHKDPEYFKCLQCNKALATRRSYESHMETHQLYERQQNVFTCEKCNKSFLKKPVFDRHVLRHVPEEERNFRCDICDKKFASEYLRKQHCTLTHSKKYAKICDICGKLIRDSFTFIRHMEEHKGEIPAKLKCDICGSELTNKYLLNRHKKIMHTEENQQEQICPYCSKVSPNSHAHRHHVKYVHTLERTHACNMCNKKFKWPIELKVHLSTHTGQPLFTCPHCPRTFTFSGNMYKHQKLWHRKQWEEARMKKEARALAGKNFLKSLDVTQDEPLCSENKSEPKLTV